MSNKKEYARFNPLELPVEQYGQYLQRFPLYTIDAISVKFAKERLTRDVLYWFIRQATHYTYLSGGSVVKEIEISTTELAQRLTASQPKISQSISKLKQDGWIECTGNLKGTKGKYLVNFCKVKKAIEEYCSIYENNAEMYENDEPAKMLVDYTNDFPTYSLK